MLRGEIVLGSENALWPLTFIEKNLDIINFRTIESRWRKIFCFRLRSLPSICYVGNMDVKCDITKNVLEIWRVFISDKNLYIIRARGMLLSDLSIMFVLQQLRYWFNVLGKFLSPLWPQYNSQDWIKALHSPISLSRSSDFQVKYKTKKEKNRM